MRHEKGIQKRKYRVIIHDALPTVHRMRRKPKVAGVYNNLTVNPKHCTIKEQAQKRESVSPSTVGNIDKRCRSGGAENCLL